MSFSSSSHTGIILTAGGVVAGLVLLVIFVVSPLLLDLGAANLAIRQGRQELSNLQAEINSYRELSLGFARSAPEREVLQKMFPLREEMVGLVEGLETAVEGAGASSKLTIIDRQEQEQEGLGRGAATPEIVISGLRRTEEIPYQLEVAGDYRQLLDFLLYLDNLGFLTEIRKLEVVADAVQNQITGEPRQNGEGTAKLEGVFFISKP